MIQAELQLPEPQCWRTTSEVALRRLAAQTEADALFVKEIVAAGFAAARRRLDYKCWRELNEYSRGRYLAEVAR